MKNFLKNIIVFFLISLVIGEIVVRLTYSVSDIPQRTIDDFGIQKYYPNQEGHWKGGEHKWMINKFGWPGELPSSYHNLIMVIGDSFIENFMNPNECHQSIFLKENMKDYNFMEAGRSGVSLIEAMEISKQMDSLNSIHTLIYVNDNDFYESIYEVKPLGDITQLKLNDNSIVYGQMKKPGLKKILYNWKLLYYFYNRFPINGAAKQEPKEENGKLMIDEIVEDESNTKNEKTLLLVNHIIANYSIKDKTLVFHPNSNNGIIKMCKNAGFNIIILDSNNDEDWTFNYDSHWTCYGHEKVAQQVSKSLLSNKFVLQKN